MVSALSAGAAGELPTEFRIFGAGVNRTEAGDFLFDDTAAKSVLAAYQKRGVDVPIDLEHLSTDAKAPHYDPDARGWCKLELRNGELWATGVTWTPDGAARLTEKRQRYVSPYFAHERPVKGAPARVLQLLNVAICADPATHKLTPLMAASRMQTRRPSPTQPTTKLANGATMDPETLSAIAQAFGLDPSASIEDILAAMGSFMAAVQSAMNGETPPPDAGAADDQGAAGGDATADPAAMAANRLFRKFEKVASLAMAAKPGAELVALRSTLLRETNRKTPIEALSVISQWKTSHANQAENEAKLETERTQLEASDRRALVGELVKLGAESPASAWKKGADGLPDGKTPAPMFARLTLDELRVHVEAKRAHAKAGVGGLGGQLLTPPASGESEEGGKDVVVGTTLVKLSAREVKLCTERKIDLAVYAANKAKSPIK